MSDDQVVVEIRLTADQAWNVLELVHGRADLIARAEYEVQQGLGGSNWGAIAAEFRRAMRVGALTT